LNNSFEDLAHIYSAFRNPQELCHKCIGINYEVQCSPQLCSKSFSSLRIVSYPVVAKYAFQLHVKTRAFLYVKCMLLLLNTKKKK